MAFRTASLPPFLPTCRSAMTVSATTVTTSAAMPAGVDYAAACRPQPLPVELAASALASGAADRAALLPLGLVQAAALFASDDAGKLAICGVHVRTLSSGAIVIEATNGHIACRLTLPAGMPWHAPESLLLPAALLTKRQPYGAFLAVLPDRLEVLGGKASRTAKHPPAGFLAALPRWGSNGDLSAYDYPRMDQLWPSDEQLPCKPGAAVGFGAQYLGIVAKAAQQLGGDSFGRCTVRVRTHTPQTPTVWELHGGAQLFGCEGSRVEFLVMPVQIRA